jgi:PKHD-type hydroxylase
MMIYPIPPRNITGKDHLAYWEGFLSSEDINLILAQPEWLNLQTGCIGGSNGSSNMDQNVRASQIAWIGMKPELVQIWEKFANAVAEVNSRYFHFDLTGFHEPMQLGLYTGDQQGHYNWHTDASAIDGHAPRKLSLAMLLSDTSEFEGGDFQVKTTSDEIQTLECAKGRAWFFPSYTLHRVAPVTKGMRRSLVLWIGGPAFR